MNPDLLKFLACPVTKQPLSLASDDMLAKINATRQHPLEQALVRADEKMAYPVVGDVPILLKSEGIAL